MIKKGNKTLHFLLALFVAVPAIMPSALTNAGFFKDVEDDHKYAQGVNYFYAKNISRGYEDGTYRPDKIVTRAEALKFIYASKDPFMKPSGTENFTDVPDDAWFAPYVAKAFDEGVTKGYGELFKPDDAITRVQFLKMLFTVHDVKVEQYTEASQALDYEDIDKESWYMPYLYFARGNSIISEVGENQIGPDAEITRAELANITYRLILNITQMKLSASEARIATTLEKINEGDFEAAAERTKEIMELLKVANNLIPENATVRGASKFAYAINSYVAAENASDLSKKKKLFKEAYEHSIDASLISDNEDIVKVATALKIKIRDRYYEVMKK